MNKNLFHFSFAIFCHLAATTTTKLILIIVTRLFERRPQKCRHRLRIYVIQYESRLTSFIPHSSPDGCIVVVVGVVFLAFPLSVFWISWVRFACVQRETNKYEPQKSPIHFIQIPYPYMLWVFCFVSYLSDCYDIPAF